MSPTSALRDYQRDCLDDLRDVYRSGKRAPILQLATGGGKTIIFVAEIKRRVSRGHRALVLVHRRELIWQACAKLDLAGVPQGIIAAGIAPTPRKAVQVASVQTLSRRLGSIRDDEFDFVVIDECHHARADTWGRVLDALPYADLLGCTATPARLDGKGLGLRSGGFFDAIVSGPSIGELIEDGHLSPVRCFAPAAQIATAEVRTVAGDFDQSQLAAVANTDAITGDAVAEYRLRADHKPAIAFCVTVKHAQDVAAAFSAAGYRSACVHGGLPVAERDALITSLGNGDVGVLTSCEIISEGLDVPAVSAVILLRPTKSLVLPMQQIGRGMRPASGKRHLVVLDHAGNIKRHGLPDQERRWSLDGIAKPTGEAPVKTCPECRAIVARAAQTCPVCGHVFWRPRCTTRRASWSRLSTTTH